MPKFSSAECVQKKSQAVVRPKNSAAPVNWREVGSTTEESRAAVQEELACNDQTAYSYQQISCLDSVIRYRDESLETWQAFVSLIPSICITS